jgi:hypothetical protein
LGFCSPPAWRSFSTTITIHTTNTTSTYTTIDIEWMQGPRKG